MWMTEASANEVVVDAWRDHCYKATTMTPPQPPRRLSPEALEYWHRRAGGLTPRIHDLLEESREHARADGYLVDNGTTTYEDHFRYGGWLQKRTIRYRVPHPSGDIRRYTIELKVGPHEPWTRSHGDDEENRQREHTLHPKLQPDEREFRPEDWPHPGGDVENEIPKMSLPPPWGARDPYDDWPTE